MHPQNRLSGSAITEGIKIRDDLPLRRKTSAADCKEQLLSKPHTLLKSLSCCHIGKGIYCKYKKNRKCKKKSKQLLVTKQFDIKKRVATKVATSLFSKLLDSHYYYGRLL
jgi:hypothetical protein